MAGLLRCAVLLSLLFLLSQCQYYTPYEALPTEPMRYRPEMGNFTWPAGVTGEFTENTKMTIRWNTTFRAVNLYVLFNHSVGAAIPPENQRQITTGNSDNAIDWTVSCSPDNPTSPGPGCASHYVFRAVDTFGDAEAQLNLGFWSRRFWIRQTAETSTSSTTSTSTQPLSINATSSTSTVASTPTDSPEMSPTTAASSSTPESQSNSTAIGAGVGAGVGGILLLLGGFLFWKHRKTKASHVYPPQPTQDQAYISESQKAKIPDSYPHYVSEAPGWEHHPQELPGQIEPQELPGRDFR